MAKNLEKVWAGLSKQRIAALHARSLQNPEHPVSKKFLAWHGTQEGGMSIGQSKKLVVADKAKQKEREQLSLQTVGATTGLAVGGEHGGAGIAQKSGEVKIYTPAEIEAINRERGTMPVELSPEEKRKNMIKAAVEKAAAKKARSFDVPTMKPQTAEVQDLIDAHRSRHYTMDEEVESVNEDQAADMQKIQSMDKGSMVGGKTELKAHLKYLNAMHTHQKKYGLDTAKTKKKIGDVSRSLVQMGEEVEQVDEANKENKAKKNAYMRLKGLKAMKAGKIDPARGHSPTRFGREMLKKEEAELYEEPKDAADEGEYDYEGDMAKSQLRSIMFNAKRMHDMLEDNTNLPEWVQSKITLAEDYISTAANYMQGEMNEQALPNIDPNILFTSGEAISDLEALARKLDAEGRTEAAKNIRKQIDKQTNKQTKTPLKVVGDRTVIPVKTTGVSTSAGKSALERANREVAARTAATGSIYGDVAKTQAEADKILKAAEAKRAREAAAAAAAKTTPRPRSLSRKMIGRGWSGVLATVAVNVAKKPAPITAAAANIAKKRRNIRGAQDRIDAAKRKEAADAAAAAAKKQEVPIAVPKPAAKPADAVKPAPAPVPFAFPNALPKPVAVPAAIPVPIPAAAAARPVKPPTKPRPFPLMYPGAQGKFERPGGLKFHRGGDVEYFPRSFQYGEIPKGYEFNSYDPTIDSSGEPIAEAKAMPGLSNLVSARKNKLAKLKASRAAPVAEESNQDTPTDKYLENRREAIREAIMSKTTNKSGK